MHDRSHLTLLLCCLSHQMSDGDCTAHRAGVHTEGPAGSCPALWVTSGDFAQASDPVTVQHSLNNTLIVLLPGQVLP